MSLKEEPEAGQKQSQLNSWCFYQCNKEQKIFTAGALCYSSSSSSSSWVHLLLQWAASDSIFSFQWGLPAQDTLFFQYTDKKGCHEKECNWYRRRRNKVVRGNTALSRSLPAAACNQYLFTCKGKVCHPKYPPSDGCRPLLDHAVQLSLWGCLSLVFHCLIMIYVCCAYHGMSGYIRPQLVTQSNKLRQNEWAADTHRLALGSS